MSVTPADVLAGTGAVIEDQTAGATITAGQVVYYDSADGLMKLAEADSATAAARVPYGIALNGASNGQPLKVQRGGQIDIGATVVDGTVYVLSGTAAGGIAPAADLTAGWFTSVIGIGIEPNDIKMPAMGPLVGGVAV